MSIANKIKALLNIQEVKTDDVVSALDLGSRQAFYNKVSRDSFTAADLVKIADISNCELAFILKDGQKLPLTIGDAKK